MFEFDPDKFWQDQIDAHERKKAKLDTFEPGDRVTKPWFTGFPDGPVVETVMNGIFIEAVPPTMCKVKWENDDEIDDDCPISFIKHAIKQTMNKERFIKTTAAAVGEEENEYVKTQWWLDTARPITIEKEGQQPYVAVETYEDKDPNHFIKCENMRTLFTDQCEYYFVCGPCYSIHSQQQWSGSTKSRGDWQGTAKAELKEHESKKGWCEFCDPIFGNGGWSLD